MPDSEFEQPARRIGGGGGRQGRFGLAVWALGLAGIVGAGILGRPSDAPSTPGTAAAPTGDARPSGGGTIEQALVLTEPTDAEVTTVALHVRGRVLPVITHIEVVVLRDEVQVKQQTVTPTKRGSFGAVFTIAGPRTAGSATVIAIGRDRHGIPIVTVRRPVHLAALVAAAIVPAAPEPSARRKLGENGLMGALALDLPEPVPVAARPEPEHPWSTTVMKRVSRAGSVKR